MPLGPGGEALGSEPSAVEAALGLGSGLPLPQLQKEKGRKSGPEQRLLPPRPKEGLPDAPAGSLSLATPCLGTKLPAAGTLGTRGQRVPAEPETPRPLLLDSQPRASVCLEKRCFPFFSETRSWNLHPLGFAIFTHPEPSGLHGDASKQQIPGGNDVTFPFPAAQASSRRCAAGPGAMRRPWVPSQAPQAPVKPRGLWAMARRPCPRLPSVEAFSGQRLAFPRPLRVTVLQPRGRGPRPRSSLVPPAPGFLPGWPSCGSCRAPVAGEAGQAGAGPCWLLGQQSVWPRKPLWSLHQKLLSACGPWASSPLCEAVTPPGQGLLPSCVVPRPQAPHLGPGQAAALGRPQPLHLGLGLLPLVTRHVSVRASLYAALPATSSLRSALSPDQ